MLISIYVILELGGLFEFDIIAINTMRRRNTQKKGLSNRIPINPIRNRTTMKYRHPSKQFMVSLGYFVSQSVQRTLENIRSLRHRLFTEFGTDCVKNFVKKCVDEVSSVGTTIDEDLRVSHGGRIALSPRVTEMLTLYEFHFPILATNLK